MAYDPNDPADKAAVQALIDEALEPILKKNKDLLGEVKKAKKGAEIDPAEVERLEGEVDNLKAQLTEANKATKAATKAAEDAGKALTSEQAYTTKALVENGLTTALMEAGVKNPVHVKAAAALIRASGAIEVKVDGETRSALIGGKALGEYVKEWSQGDDGKAFVTAPDNSGGGAGGSKGAGAGGSGAGNMGGNKNDRVAALNARFPELAKT